MEVRYAVLDSALIYNYIMSQPSIPKHIDLINKTNGHFIKIEKHVLENGIRNPIIVNCGWCTTAHLYKLPTEYQKDQTDLIICEVLGGSRLWVAQRNNLEVPCFINDAIGRFKHCPLIEDAKTALTYFKDKPKRIMMGGHGISVAGSNHVHLLGE
jgi:hypothetical protein